MDPSDSRAKIEETAKETFQKVLDAQYGIRVPLEAMETEIGGPKILQQQPASQWTKFDACIIVKDKPSETSEELERTFTGQFVAMKRDLHQKLTQGEPQIEKKQVSRKKSKSKSSEKTGASDPVPATLESVIADVQTLKALVETLQTENSDLKTKHTNLELKVVELSVWKRVLHERQLAKTVIEIYRKERERDTGRVFTRGDWAKLIAELREDLGSIPPNLQQLNDEDFGLLLDWIRGAKVYAHPPIGAAPFTDTVRQMAIDAGANPESVTRISQYYRSRSIE